MKNDYKHKIFINICIFIYLIYKNNIINIIKYIYIYIYLIYKNNTINIIKKKIYLIYNNNIFDIIKKKKSIIQFVIVLFYLQRKLLLEFV